MSQARTASSTASGVHLGRARLVLPSALALVDLLVAVVLVLLVRLLLLLTTFVYMHKRSVDT